MVLPADLAEVVDRLWQQVPLDHDVGREPVGLSPVLGVDASDRRSRAGRRAASRWPAAGGSPPPIPLNVHRHREELLRAHVGLDQLENNLGNLQGLAILLSRRRLPTRHACDWSTVPWAMRFNRSRAKSCRWSSHRRSFRRIPCSERLRAHHRPAPSRSGRCRGRAASFASDWVFRRDPEIITALLVEQGQFRQIFEIGHVRSSCPALQGPARIRRSPDSRA